MATQVIIVLLLTFLINLVTTLSYAVRMVGIRTGRIAVSFALFNMLVLISRTANGFQAPLLAKTVENDIRMGITSNESVFRWIILSCSIGTIFGAVLIPTFQRILSKAVIKFSEHKSMLQLAMHGFSKTGVTFFKESITIPSEKTLAGLKIDREFPWRIFIFNMLAVAIVSIGVLSSVYAAYLNPEFRTTASNLAAFINGFATIILFVFIDPYLSIMTDDVVLGKRSEASFRKNIIYMVFARLLGTLLAQALFIPSAQLISWIATII